MTSDRTSISKQRAAHREAPASGCFGYTHTQLVEPRGCAMDAALFARFYADSADTGSANLVSKVPAKPR